MAQRHGLRACWSTPIHCSAGKVLGTFAIYYREPRHPTPAELEVIVRAVHVARIAIERKRAEENIHRLTGELEQRVTERTAELADLYNNAPCGYHSLDGDGLFMGINDTELAWLGYAREEVVGKMNATDLMTPASGEIFRENYPAFKDSGRLENLELAIVRKDGSILPVLLLRSLRHGPGEEEE